MRQDAFNDAPKAIKLCGCCGPDQDRDSKSHKVLALVRKKGLNTTQRGAAQPRPSLCSRESVWVAASSHTREKPVSRPEGVSKTRRRSRIDRDNQPKGPAPAPAP